MSLKLKLNIGCGSLNQWPNCSTDKHKIPKKYKNWTKDWVNIDKFKKNKDIVPMHVGKKIEFPTESVYYIVCEHMLEHLRYFRRMKFIKEAYRVLKKGGNLRIAIPDANSRNYISGKYGHKIDFTLQKLLKYFNKKYWQYDIIAYHDENGKYYKKKIDFNKGYIGRISKDTEESLVIDFIKV